MITKLVGARISQLRAETGLSQVDFSSKIGMARSYFGEVESGKRNISMRGLARITGGFDVTLAEFFDSEIFDVLYRPRTFDKTPARIDYASVSLLPDSKRQR